MLLPALQQAREKARRINCVSNLKQIGTACKMYAGDFGSKLPGSLEQLRSNEFLTDYNVYVCPSSVTTAGSGSVSLTYEGTSPNLSYAYQAGMIEGDDANYGRSDSGLSADLNGTGSNVDSNNGKPNHNNYGSVLFQGGHVLGFTGEGWFSPANVGYPAYKNGDEAITPNKLVVK